MTQHSNWNRLYYPFISCTSKFGSRCDEEYKCTGFEDIDYILYIMSSKSRWYNRVTINANQLVFTEIYDASNHLYWCDKKIKVYIILVLYHLISRYCC